MAAYLIADMEVTDAELLAQFSNRIGALVEAHNGRYLVRRGIIEVVESDRTHDRVVVIEFEDLGKARAFVNSPEYQELAKIRSRSTICSTIICDGVSG